MIGLFALRCLGRSYSNVLVIASAPWLMVRELLLQLQPLKILLKPLQVGRYIRVQCTTLKHIVWYPTVPQSSPSLSFADRRQLSLLAALPESVDVVHLRSPEAHFSQSACLAHALARINNKEQVQGCFQKAPALRIARTLGFL